MQTCPGCGQSLQENHKFCPRCGRPAAAPQVPPVPPAPNPAPVSETPSGSAGAHSLKEMAWLPLALAVLGFLIMYYVTIVFGCIVSGVGGVLAYQRYQQDKGAMSVVGIVVNVLVCVFGIIAYIIP